jgi:16S rRNA (uracil1498-N3)-methyltransferase
VSHTFRYLIDHEPVPGERVILPAADAHHLVRVVRRRVGDAVEVIDPGGAIWPATLVAAGESTMLEVTGTARRTRSPAALTLFVGLCEWGRLDVAVEKCTELGVARIVIFAGSRSQRVPMPASWGRRRERLVRVAQAAARQAGQGAPPEIDGVWTFEAVRAALGREKAIMLDPSGQLPLMRALEAVPAEDPLAVVIGPDAGFAPQELAQARAVGAEVCHLGGTTLRAETAAIVAATIVLAATGHLERTPGVASNHREAEA